MTNEQRYFDALKSITRYDTPERLQKHSEKMYGLSYHEALEMAYENIKSAAYLAIQGRRRPKAKA